MYDFNYVRPGSLAEAVEAMKGEEAEAIVGGQTLIPTLKQRLAMPGVLVDLSGVPEMQGIRVSGDIVSIGGATTHARVAGSAEIRRAIPALAELAHHIGDPQVRNLGTVGGSLANNDPSACYPAALLGLGGTVHSSAGRAIPADEFFRGMFTTALEEGELIVSVDLPVPEAANYQKFAQPASRFALVGVFAARMKDGARVAVTGAAEDGVFRWREAEQALAGRWSAEAVSGLALSPEGMMRDIHASPEYRAHLAGVLTARAVDAAG